MNLKLKQAFLNHWLKLDEVYEKMFYSLKGRLEKYWNWNIWISRKEYNSEIYKEFNLSENQLKYRIQKLKELEFLSWGGKMYSRKPATYTASPVLLWIFKLFETWKKYIKNLSKKIVEFVNNTDAKAYLSNLWMKFKNYRSWILSKKKGEKITVWSKWAISIWGKEAKHFNLFNFLKESYWLNNLEMCEYLKIN